MLVSKYNLDHWIWLLDGSIYGTFRSMAPASVIERHSFHHREYRLLDELVRPEFIAALYEVALEPDGLRYLVQVVGDLLGVDGLIDWLAEDGPMADVELYEEVSRTGRADLLPLIRSSRGVLDGFSATIPSAKIVALKLDEMPAHLAAVRRKAIIPYVLRALELRKRRLVPALSRPPRALDALTFAIVVCDAKAQVIYANSAAQALARERIGIVIRTSDRSIAAAIPAESRKLRILIEAAAVGRPGSQLLPGRDGRSSFMLLVAPLRDGGQRMQITNEVMIALRHIGSVPDFDATRLIDLFRLSPAQAILAIGLYQGKSFGEIAAERGVKVTTLRTHFAEVLSRTGSNSLRDLVRLLGLIPPLL